MRFIIAFICLGFILPPGIMFGTSRDSFVHEQAQAIKGFWAESGPVPIATIVNVQFLKIA
jgi:hypothetical protein